MELLGRAIVYPILWIVYIMLPFLDGPLSSLPSFKPSSPQTVWEDLPGHRPLGSREFWGVALRLLCFYLFLVLPTTAGSWYILGIIGPQAITSQNWPVTILLNIAIIIVWLIWTLSLNFAGMISFFLLLGLFIVVLVPSLQCLIYVLRLFIYLGIKAVTHVFIVGFKNRRACQFLSALALVLLLGVTEAKVCAAITVAYGIFLTIPDLDPDPWTSFKLRFSHFLKDNMDEESLDAVLYSQSFKMVSCNEMMPVLRPVRATTTGACFVLRENFSNEDGHFTVEPEYRIGLGSITTATRRDVIDVRIFTPYSGARRKRMKNTPRARFNLDMSARFWRDHPEVGIWNEVLMSTQRYYDEAKIHCISIDKWITFCGSDNYVFMEYDCELGI